MGDFHSMTTLELADWIIEEYQTIPTCMDHARPLSGCQDCKKEMARYRDLHEVRMIYRSRREAETKEKSLKSLKDVFEETSRQVAEGPDWLKEIYARNERLRKFSGDKNYGK